VATIHHEVSPFDGSPTMMPGPSIDRFVLKNFEHPHLARGLFEVLTRLDVALAYRLGLPFRGNDHLAGHMSSPMRSLAASSRSNASRMDRRCSAGRFEERSEPPLMPSNTDVVSR
jgi:hypothetical protein